MKVYFHNSVKEYKSEVKREKILKDFGLNPVSVIFIDKKTKKLIPVSKRLSEFDEIEIRTVISGG